MAAEQTNKIESLEELDKETNGDYDRWMSEITAAEKELEKWRKRGRKIVKEYRAAKPDSSGIDSSMERKFNLFTANVQILQTSLFNQLPEPSVVREFGDFNDDAARVAGLIMERALSNHTKRNHEIFDLIHNVVEDNLVPGVGVSWHTYKADIEERTMEPTEEMLAINPEAPPLTWEEVVNEQLVDEYVYWEDFVWSPARSWQEVRWIGRKLYLTRDQLVKRFGKKKGKAIALDHSPKRNETSVETKNQVFQQAVVYEIWDKEEREVYWFSKAYPELLDEKKDFLLLEDFFPCPKPLFATTSNGQLIPIPDYEYARDQYRELNEINTRISLLIRACRVAGVYDKATGQVSALINNAAENTLVPVDSWAAFAEKGGIKGAIDWLPLDQIVKTLEQLYKGREDVKQQIYEVTGMSDIIRGASKASETLGAQKIKAQYASMRIQNRQKAVVYYTSQMFDIQSQLMRQHMDVETIARLAQVQFMGEDQALVQAALELLKSEDFELRCQVESASLSDIDFQAEKQDRMEMMGVVSGFIRDAGPTLTDPIMGPFLGQLISFSLAGFKSGRKFEGQLDKMIQQLTQKAANPQPPPPTPEEKKLQMEMEIMQQEAQLDSQGKQMELQFKGQELGMNLKAKQAEMQAAQQKTQQDLQANNLKHQQGMQMTLQKAAVQAQATKIQQAAQPKPTVQ